MGLNDIFAGKVPGVKANMVREDMDEEGMMGKSVNKSFDTESKIFGNVMGRKNYKVNDPEQTARISALISETRSSGKTMDSLRGSSIDVDDIIGRSSKGIGEFDVGSYLGTTKARVKGGSRSNNIHNILYGRGAQLQHVLGGSVSRGKFNPLSNIMGSGIGIDKRAKNRSIGTKIYGGDKRIADIIGTGSSNDQRLRNILGSKSNNKLHNMLGGDKPNAKLQSMLGHTTTHLHKDVREMVGGANINPIGRILGPTYVRRDIYGRNAKGLNTGGVLFSKDFSQGYAKLKGKIKPKPVMLEVYGQPTLGEQIGQYGQKALSLFHRNSPVEIYTTTTEVAGPTATEVRTVEEGPEVSLPERLLSGGREVGKVAGAVAALPSRFSAGIKSGYGEVVGKYQPSEGEVQQGPGFFGILGKQAGTFFGTTPDWRDVEITPQDIDTAKKMVKEGGISQEEAINAIRKRKLEKQGPSVIKTNRGLSESQVNTLALKYFGGKKPGTPEGFAKMLKTIQHYSGGGERESPFVRFTEEIGKGSANVFQAMPSVEQAAMRLTPLSTGQGIMEATAGVAATPMTSQRARMFTGGGSGYGFGQMVGGRVGTGQGFMQMIGKTGFSQDFDSKMQGALGVSEVRPEPMFRPEPTESAFVPPPMPSYEPPEAPSYESPAIPLRQQTYAGMTAAKGPTYSSLSRRIVGYTRGPYSKTLSKQQMVEQSY